MNTRMSTMHLVAMVVVGCLVGSVFSTTCNISPSGQDAGDCSTSPCNTIDYCIKINENVTNLIVSFASGNYSTENCGVIIPRNSTYTSLSFQAPHSSPNSVTIDCNSVQQHFVFADSPSLSVEINDIIFLNGNSANMGGCIFASNIKSLVLQNAVFENCYAWNSGGAVYSNVSSNILDSNFTGNKARNGGGGALYLAPPLNGTTVDKCIITDNVAPQGAGLFVVGDYLALTNSDILYNSASVAGGGLYIVSDTPTNVGTYNFLKTVISNNTATGNGGGLYAENLNHQFNVLGALFQFNVATSPQGDSNIACGNATSLFCHSCVTTDCQNGCPATVDQSCSQTNATTFMCYGNSKFQDCLTADACVCTIKGLSTAAKVVIGVICACLFAGIVLITFDVIRHVIKKRSEQRGGYTPL